MVRSGRYGDSATARRADGDRDLHDDGVVERRDGQAVAHERFGGINWGAAFFGWLAANGLTVLLLALLAAAGAAIGLTQTSPQQAASQANSQPGVIGLGGALALLLVLAIGYFAGGYVAGRMSRFDGHRQGLGVWIMGLLVTILLAVAGAVLGDKYNVLAQLNLPRIPVSEGTLGTAGLIALIAVLIVTLLASVLGGRTGQRYHYRVDRVVRSAT
jgi:hypothetical protein